MNFFRFMGWNKSFSKSEDAKIECYCSDSNGFYITKRQASAATSIIIVICTLALIMGYLWGQRNVIREFTSKVINDSFDDQINYSMYSMYGENNSSDEEDKDNINNEEQIKTSNTLNVSKEIKTQPVETISNNVDNNQYYAQLVGFGSRKSADQFLNKLQKKGYTIHIEPRKSKTSKGKVITWYQAVTEKFDNKQKLEEIVNQIKASEHLNDVKFMTVPLEA